VIAKIAMGSSPAVLSLAMTRFMRLDILQIYPQNSQVQPSHTPRETPSNSPAATPNSLKIDKEVARLKEAMDEASPEALHQLLRQESVFLYTPLDEDHLSYILCVTLKNSTPVIVEVNTSNVDTSNVDTNILDTSVIRPPLPSTIA
jgi:hypothetical protein